VRRTRNRAIFCGDPRPPSLTAWRFGVLDVMEGGIPLASATPTLRSAHPALVQLALAVGGFAIGTTEFATMSLVPDMARDLQISEPVAGHVISAYALGVVVGAPLFAVLSARMAQRSVLILLMTLFALANGLSAIAPNYHAMMLFRFCSGLPHGAYFGIAMLLAASLVPVNRRSAAVGRVILGLTVATIVGVPLANGLGQAVGWRWSFVVVTGLALLTAGLVALYAPRDKADSNASPVRELGALRNRAVWLTLLTGAIGFGGLFSVYTYLASTLTEVTGASPHALPFVLAVFGVGMTIGNLVVPRFADRALMPTAGFLLLYAALCLAAFPFAAYALWSITLVMFLIGTSAALATVLQTRLMDVAGDGQRLAAALNHSAFNTANALGPWLGGLAITAGYGWTSTGWVGVGLALGGLLVWALSGGIPLRR
jgi:DHA1 family inner membrane transport protein